MRKKTWMINLLIVFQAQNKIYSAFLSFQMSKISENIIEETEQEDFLNPSTSSTIMDQQSPIELLESSTSSDTLCLSPEYSQPFPRKYKTLTDKILFEPRSPIENNFPSTVKQKSASTLIVAPTTLFTQWKKELERHSQESSLTVFEYYGSSKDSSFELSTYDVVLTTYGTLQNEFSKSSRSRNSIFDYNWFRVILDEAHQIKNHRSKTAQAACALNAEYRWCLTGTPLQNNLEELFSLLQFLRVEIWGDYSCWSTYVGKKNSGLNAAAIVKAILKPILLRRTKSSTYSDRKSILELGKKTVKTCFVEMTPEGSTVYTCLYERGRSQFARILKEQNPEKREIIQRGTDLYPGMAIKAQTSL